MLSRSVRCLSSGRSASWLGQLADPLEVADPDVFNIMEREKQRQRNSLCLIPSENFPSAAVLSALGSVMQNKYSEGYPGARYYGGNEFIDQSELLCQQRALEAYGLDPEKWGVNVQPLSGAPANFYVYTAVLGTHGRMMALDLPHGGHLSHGYATATKKVSAVSEYFECLPYRLDESTGLVDYDALEKNAEIYRPKLLVSGASAYSRLFDFARLRKIADLNKSLFMYDMAHISGLVAAGVLPSPFDHSDIVTTTTHKSLRGPRGAMIFFRKGVRSVDKKGKETMYDLENPINSAVFPGHQGGPHNHTITAISVALKQALSPEFKEYQKQVLANSLHLTKVLADAGHSIVSGGTDNHLCLMDLKPHGVDGSKVERVLEMANIALNKNTVPGDRSALVPGGVRLGTPAVTTRGMVEADMDVIAKFVCEGIELAVDVHNANPGKLKKFTETLNSSTEFTSRVQDMRARVVDFARTFPTVGFPESTMVYKD